MGWSGICKYNTITNSNLPLSVEEGVQSVCPASLDVRCKKLGVSKVLARKLRSAQKGLEMKMLGIAWRNRKRTSWIRELIKVEDILVTIKRKKWACAGLVMGRSDKRWTTKVREWQARNCRCQGRQRTRLRDDRDRRIMLGEACILQWSNNG